VLVCVSVHLSVSVIRCNNKSPRLQEAGIGPSKKERKKEKMVLIRFTGRMIKKLYVQEHT